MTAPTRRVVPIGRLDGLADGAAKGFDHDAAGRPSFFVVRRGDTLRAFHDACPHWPGSPLAWRRDAYLNAEGTRIVCASHGAQFDVDSGLCTAGPCVGAALQPVRVVPAADGTLEAWVGDDVRPTGA